MSARAQAVMAPRLPQVNLLPPEVKAARGLAKIKTWLGLGVLAVLVIAAGVVVMATLDQRGADEELAEVKDDTVRLQGVLAQYVDVPVYQSAVRRALTVRELGMSPEILWQPYLLALAATAPENVRFQNVHYEGASPTSAAAAPANILQAESVGTITFDADVLTITDVANWERALATVPGFSDPWITLAIIGEEDGSVHYSVTGTVQVQGSAFANRYPATEPEETLAPGDGTGETEEDD